MNGRTGRGALVVLALVLGTPIAWAQSSYAWCGAGERDYGRKHFVSSVFRVKTGVYHVGMQNAYNQFLRDGTGTPLAGSICSVSFQSFQEAEAARNDWVARLRRDNVHVQLVDWAYRGD